jgi:hypothetical protein
MRTTTFRSLSIKSWGNRRDQAVDLDGAGQLEGLITRTRSMRSTPATPTCSPAATSAMQNRNS